MCDLAGKVFLGQPAFYKELVLNLYVGQNRTLFLACKTGTEIKNSSSLYITPVHVLRHDVFNLK